MIVPKQKLVFKNLNAHHEVFCSYSTTDYSGMGTGKIQRSKIPGGWLVVLEGDSPSITFVPDPQYRWDGGSLE